jgi:hypothetical protein
MITLRHKIAYAGDLADSPLKTVTVAVQVPTYEYAIGGEKQPVARRVTSNLQSDVIQQPLGAKSYQIALDDTFVAGDDTQTRELARQYSMSALQSGSAADLAVSAVVRYLSDAGVELGRQSLDLICIPKLDLQAELRPEAEPRSSRTAFIAVNRQAFLGLQKKLGGAMAADEGLLLHAISLLTAPVDDVPTRLEGAEADFGRWLERQSVRTGGVDASTVFNGIRSSFDALYDFALIVPEIEALKIAGTLTIIPPEDRAISAKDFLPYQLSAQCIYASQDSPLVLTYRFTQQVAVNAGAAAFSLTGAPPVLRNDLVDPVTVAVKGIDGSLIWSKEFSADDATLATLQISVPLQGSVTLTAAPSEAEKEQSKRLRGRVLSYDKECVLKDALVLVQANPAKGDPWRVVGAATTDASGNFSIPYPYGTYAEAQALVSLAPKEPATIPIISEGGNETISDAFLYLLLLEPFCAPPEDGDCECSAPGQAGRLPDYADLIGSDSYSQDIGGSCVNLSKPNRTISEFNYQAIVRTSDPDVANYVLNRIEAGLDSIDVSLAMALASNANALASAVSAAVAEANANLANMPTVGNGYVATALNAASPHAAAAAQALSQRASAVTMTVLATSEGHLDALIGILEANKALLVSNDLPNDPAEMDGILDAASALKALVTVAIDTVGTSARYELTGGQSKTIRRPIDSDNPVDWQDAPESQPMQPPAPLKHAGVPAKHSFKHEVLPSDPSSPDQAATLSQAVTLATGHILHYKALFKADGYSLGDLIYSLPLAPGQKKEIVVFDASHTLAGAESQALSQNERLAMGLVDERDITNQLGGRVSESLRGSSTANTSGISAGFGTGGQGSGGTGAYGGSGSAVLGVAGGVANANSTAKQDSSRDVSEFFGEKLRQSIMQNADSYRQLNASVVSTVQEGQRYGVTSEVVANHNHCHALTMMYFEVLRHFAIFQELSSVEECVFVPFLLTRFTTENVARWRDILAPALLPMPSDTYLQPFSAMAGLGRQHPLIKAFDADQRIKTHYANVDFPAGAYDNEPIRFVKGEMLLRVDLPRPKTRYDRIKSLPVTTKTVTTQEIDPQATAKQAWFDAAAAGLSGGLSTLFTGPPGTNIQYSTKETQVQVKQAIFDAFMTLDANYESVPPAQCIRVVNFTPASISFGGVTVAVSGLDFFQDGIADRDLWIAYSKLLGYSDVFKMLNYYFRGRLVAEWDEIFYNDIAPLVFRKIVESIRISEINADFTAESKYTGGERLVPLFLSGTVSKKRNQLPPQLNVSVSSPDVRALGDAVTLNIENMNVTYSTAHSTGLLYGGNVNNDLLDGALLDIPENPDEKRNPRREDRYLAAKLIEHLNSNLEYYNKVLWYRLDQDRRFMLLDGFSIQIFKDDGTPVPGTGGMRSLASVVKNELIAVSGNSFVFPVAPGYKVNGSFVQPEDANGTEPVTLFDHYKPLTPVEPYRISVPSKGVFAEAVQGVCNACEKIETERLQDWSRFPIGDEPTPISPVSVPVPVVTDWQAAFKDFAAPIVNVQNAPAIPAPGAGLASLGDLLSKSGVFKDITGLDANQQNVIRTYLSNQENAKAFAEMAKEMAMQTHNTQNSGKIMDSLSAAKGSGALNQEDYGKLVKDHLQQQIDGGQTAKAETKLTAPSLTKAAVDAANRGADVKAFKSDNEGNTEAIEAGQVLLTAGGRAPAQTTGVGGVVTRRPPPGSTGLLSKMGDWASKLATAALSSKEDQLQQALTDAALKIAEEELAKAVDAIPFGKALRLTVRYSTVFADAAGVVIEDSRREIQDMVDQAVMFSQDNGMTDEDKARIQSARSYLAIAMQDTVKALEAGLEATVEAILEDAAGELAEAAGDVTSQITGKISEKLLSASKVDRAALAVAQAIENNVPAARLKVYQKLGTKLVRLTIASFADSKPTRARLEAVLTAAGGPEPAAVGVLRSLVEIGVSSLAHGVDPLANLFPRDSELDTITLSRAVEYEAKRAAKALIDELKQDGWTFGAHNGYSGIVVDGVGKHIDLPTYEQTDLEYGPSLPSDMLGLLDDDLATDEQALATVHDGLTVAIMLRAAAYQADIDAAPGGLWEARFEAGSAACQQDAVDATVAMRDAANGLRSRYVGTPLEAASATALPAAVISPATLRRPPGSGISMA